MTRLHAFRIREPYAAAIEAAVNRGDYRDRTQAIHHALYLLFPEAKNPSGLV